MVGEGFEAGDEAIQMIAPEANVLASLTLIVADRSYIAFWVVIVHEVLKGAGDNAASQSVPMLRLRLTYRSTPARYPSAVTTANIENTAIASEGRRPSPESIRMAHIIDLASTVKSNSPNIKLATVNLGNWLAGTATETNLSRASSTESRKADATSIFL